MLTINKKDMNMLHNYKSWLISKGYAKTTIVDYVSCIKRVCRWENKTAEELIKNISDTLQQYTIGEHSARGRLKSRAIKASIVTCQRWLLESQAV